MCLDFPNNPIDFLKSQNTTPHKEYGLIAQEESQFITPPPQHKALLWGPAIQTHSRNLRELILGQGYEQPKLRPGLMIPDAVQRYRRGENTNSS